MKGTRDLVHEVRRRPLLSRPPEQFEDARPAQFRRQVRHARHHVEVHMREALDLGELCHVGFDAARHIVEYSGQPDLPCAQRHRLSVSELMDRRDVSARQQYQPTRERGVKCMSHPPVPIENDALTKQ